MKTIWTTFLAAVCSITGRCPAAPLLPVAARVHSLLVASWYGPGFEGKQTASAVRFTSDRPIIAHRTLPFGARVRLRFGSQEAVGIVLDRGPWIKKNGRFTRDLDISRALAAKLGLIDRGVGKVDAEVLEILPKSQWEMACAF